MSLGSPNITIGSLVFRPTKVDGEYTWDSATPANPVKLNIRSSRIKNGVMRIQIERLTTIPATASEPKAVERAYMVLEVPPVSGSNATSIALLTSQIATLLSTAGIIAALLREEV